VIGLIMFGITLMLLMIGFPVAFTFAGVAVIFGTLTEGIDLFGFIPYRIMSVMQNTILMAVPLFIFMGIVLQKTKLAEQLLEAMGDLFGGIRGGLAVSTILVGSLLAASTGVVGASVIAMGVISLPVMLKHNYKKNTFHRGYLRLRNLGANHSAFYCAYYFGRCVGRTCWGFISKCGNAVAGLGWRLYFVCVDCRPF